MFTGNVQFLKANESNFTGTSGDKVTVVYVSVLTEKGDVIELTATKEMAPSFAQYKKGEEIRIEFNLYMGKTKEGKEVLKAKIISAELSEIA